MTPITQPSLEPLCEVLSDKRYCIEMDWDHGGEVVTKTFRNVFDATRWATAQVCCRPNPRISITERSLA